MIKKGLVTFTPALRPRPIRLAISLALVLLAGLDGLASAGEPPAQPPLRKVRSFPVSAAAGTPTGIAFAWQADQFVLLAGPQGHGSADSLLTGLTRFEDPVGTATVTTDGVDPLTSTFDRHSGSMFLLEGASDQLIQIPLSPGGGLDSLGAWRHDVRHLALDRPRGMTSDPLSGEVFILDGQTVPRLVRVAPLAAGDLAHTLATGALTTIALPGELAGSRGLTFDPFTGRLFTLSADGATLVVLTTDGSVSRTHALAPFGLRAPRNLVVAPNADGTDAPERTSLYLLDETASAKTRLVELTYVDPAVLAQGQAAQNAAAATNATLIRTTYTSNYDPPAPDTAGITWIAPLGRLLISDCEVNEMPIFGANLFEVTKTGSLQHTGDTLDWSEEPTGLSYHPGNGTVFMSDDDFDMIFEVDPGSDGIWGTNDDDWTALDTREFNSQDPEGVCYDPVGDQLFIVDGESDEVYKLRPGPNGIFDGLEGDDIMTHFDLASLGAQDPEGICYNPAAGTLFVSDTGAKQVLEVTTSGTLLRVINISVADPDNAAGVVYAPGSSNPSVLHLYVVDRGVDNDSDPSENDGRMYEFSLGNDPTMNSPPNVNAGADQTVLQLNGAVLGGSVGDDGQPDPPGAVSSSWSKLSGPGQVTFGDATEPITLASFSGTGTYVLRLNADDGDLSASDDVQIVVLAGGGGAIEKRVGASLDDAEETPDSTVTVSSGDLDMVSVGNAQQVVGMRFTGLPIAQGATVVSAHVQFQADETHSGATALTIRGQAADDAPTFATIDFNITNRPLTSAAVPWVPAPWTNVGDQGFAQQTPDLSSVIQEIVNRPGWAAGHGLVLVISGTGVRTAESYDGNAAAAPLLHVQLGTDPGPNEPPVVDAGPDQSIFLPALAVLDGTVTDDGPESMLAGWSQVSGPGATTFGDPSAVDTTAAFSTPGVYVLRLTADDGQLSASDDVEIEVLGFNGPGTIERAVLASADDGEELSGGNVTLSSSDLEIVAQGADVQTVGLRFTSLAIPQGAYISAAHVQFTADETHTGATALSIQGQATDDAAAFTTAGFDISARPRTSAAVSWVPAPWSAGQQGPAQQTPDLTAVLQEIVNRPGWTPGNDLALVITGTGLRTAKSYDGSPAGAARLHVEYDTERPPNQAPLVSAGPDQSIMLPAEAVLDGTVSDDDLLLVTTTWSRISGPGVVSFGDLGAVDTTASFSLPGSYVLRLTADDGEFAPFDQLTVFVDPANTPPVVLAGVDLEIQLPADALLDGTVTDDDLLAVTTTWSQVSGPGAVSFGDASAVDTTASFSLPGSYVLRLTADDGEFAPFDELTVSVDAANTPPLVSAGLDVQVLLGTGAALDGTVSDDVPLSVTTGWSQVSGPGTAHFADAAAVDTTASFSVAGTYVLRLTADDGEFAPFDDVTVSVTTLVGPGSNVPGGLRGTSSQTTGVPAQPSSAIDHP